MNHIPDRPDDFLEDPTFRNWVFKTNASDTAFWDNWLIRHPDQRPLAETAAEILRGIHFNKKPFDTSITHQDWQMLRQRLQDRRELRIAPAGTKRINFYRAAAAVILFLMVAGTTLLLRDRMNRVSYAADFGEIEQVRLPDGSWVTLNADSRLYFHKNWDKRGIREVWLEGEAFFSVRKQMVSGGRVKFIVHTSDLNVEVLGTEFNVRKRKDQTRVTLASGKVRIDLQEEGHENIALEPGEQVAFSRTSNSIEKRRVETQKYTAWKERKLILDHKTLAEVGEIIRETYGRKVVFKDNHLKSLTLSGSYPLDDMDKLLRALRTAAQITITYDKKEIIFKE